MFEDAKKNAIVVYRKITGELVPEKGGVEWVNECIMVMRIRKDAEQILEVKEFVNSQKAMQMRSQVKPKDFDA